MTIQPRIVMMLALLLAAFIANFASAQEYNRTIIRLSKEEIKEIYKFRHQKGVNVGGIFVLERWMNGRFFDGIPDWVGTSIQAYTDGINNAEVAKRNLDDRAANWINECDYAQIAQLGLNTVRLPIGYWALGDKFPDTPMLPPFNKWTSVYNNTLEQIHTHFKWAQKYGLGVLLDLHGAPGSQNGADHSGNSGNTDLYNSDININTTVNVLRRLTEIFKEYDNMVGIELLNEPRDHDRLQQLYREAYRQIRQVDPSMPIYICDTVWTSNVHKWADFINQNNWELGFLDAHIYYAFNGGGTPADRYPDIIQYNDRPWLTNVHNTRAGLVIGEWSNALNTGSYNGFSEQQKKAIRKQVGERQLETYNNIGGYHFWTWKTDNNVGDWDLSLLIKEGIFPSDFGCWPPNSCTQERRESLKDLALERHSERRQQGLASHQAYWARENPNGRYDWNQYLAGFDDGYMTAMRFHYAMSSRIGMRRELAAWRTKQYTAKLEKQHLSTSNVWQYRDGFLEGIQHLEAVYESASS